MGQTRRVYWVYMLHCGDGTLYTGIADNLIRRYWQHLTKKARCKYTQSRHPLRLVQCWSLFGSRGDAIRVERCIKQVTRKQKELLVTSPQLLKVLATVKLGQELEIEVFYPWFADGITRWSLNLGLTPSYRSIATSI